MSFIQIKNLTKKYENFVALDDFSTNIQDASVIGLVGPNGAGKSTFLRILNQIYQPTSGQIFVEGEKLNPSQRHLFGYLPEDKGLYQDINLYDQLIYFARLKGLTVEESTREVNYWLEKFELSNYKKKKIKNLSKGMQQKIQFISAVVHNPKIVVLDEPLSGLDPLNSQVINDYIKEAKINGKIVIFSTHRMEQTEELCDSLLMINKGKKVLDGNLSRIKEQNFDNSYSVSFSDFNKTFRYLKKLETVEIVDQNTDKQTFQIKLKNISINQIVKELCEISEVQNVQAIYPTINQIFLKYAS